MNKASAIIATFLFFICAGVVLSQDDAVKAEKAVKAERAGKYKEFCSNHWSNGDKVSVSDLRVSTLPATGSLNIDSGRNGGISVKGENRQDVLLRACVQAWGITENDAQSIASNVRISTNGQVKAEGPDHGWSVSFEAHVPLNTNLLLRAQNGGIGISSVEGMLEFETVNGGVSLKDVAGDVRGRTTNGGVNVVLAGNAWKGPGLDVQTTNGGVNLMMPETYAANIETGTVNGGFKSDIPSLNIATEDVRGGWNNRSKEIRTSINGGGAPIKVTTRNGGIRIRALSN
ncbi:MAG: hypothetical protein AB7F88_16310 [Pyrinomonadaceae bacterium]